MGWCVFCTWLFHTLLKLNFLHVNGLSESANRRLAQVSIIVIESSTKYAETQVLVDGFHVLTQKHRPTTAVRKAQSVAPHKKQPHRSFMIRKTTLGYLIYFDIAKLEHENHNQLIPLGGTTWNWWLEAFRKKKQGVTDGSSPSTKDRSNLVTGALYDFSVWMSGASTSALLVHSCMDSCGHLAFWVIDVCRFVSVSIHSSSCLWIVDVLCLCVRDQSV